jgi:hypothetical protein
MYRSILRQVGLCVLPFPLFCLLSLSSVSPSLQTRPLGKSVRIYVVKAANPEGEVGCPHPPRNGEGGS